MLSPIRADAADHPWWAGAYRNAEFRKLGFFDLGKLSGVKAGEEGAHWLGQADRMPGTVARDREYVTAQWDVHSAADFHLSVDIANDRVIEACVASARADAMSHERMGDFVRTPSQLRKERHYSSRHWNPSWQAVGNPARSPQLRKS